MTTEFKGMPEVAGVPTKFTVDTYTTLVETGLTSPEQKLSKRLLALSRTV